MIVSLLLAVALTGPDAGLVEAFAALLEKDDVGSIHELAPESVDAGTAWIAATEVMDRYDCIEVQSVAAEVVRDGSLGRVWKLTVAATGVTSGGVRRAETLPDVWYLTTVPTEHGWRIAEVTTEDLRLADAMIAAASDDVRRALLDNGVDLRRFATTLAWRTTEPAAGQRGFAAIRFASELAASLGDATGVAFAKQMEARLAMLLRCNDDARRAAAEALDLALTIGDADAIGNSWFMLAGAHWRSGDWPTAMVYFRRAGALADLMADPRPAIKSYVNVANIEPSRSRALEAANEIERLSRKYGWLQGQLDALFYRSTIGWLIGNHVVADHAGREAYELAVKLRRPDRIRAAAANLGVDAAARGDHDEAIRFLRGATGDPEHGLYARIELAHSLGLTGRIEEAIELLERSDAEAIAKKNSGLSVFAKVRLSQLFRREGDAPRALELARAARDIFARDPGFPVSRWGLKLIEGAALRANGLLSEAEAAFEAGVAHIEEDARTLLVDAATHTDLVGERADVYHQLIELYLLSGCTTHALRLGERIKGSLLEGMHVRDHADAASHVTREERAQQRRNEEELARLNRELFSAKLDDARREAVKAKLAAARADYEALETVLRGRLTAARQVRRIDPLENPDALVRTDDEVVLDYIVTERQTMLFVLSREAGRVKIDVHTIGAGRAALVDDVSRFLDRLAGGSFEYRDDAHRLHRLLLAPAAPALVGKKSVVIVPDGPLWELPFQALERGDGKPLVARVAIAYAPSLASLLRPPAPPPTQPALLAIGNPRFDDGAATILRSRTRAAIGDLPDAATEARRIAALYDRGRSRVLIGRDATERALKEEAPHYDVVHIAAHAVADDEQPLYSSILLARDAGDDGLLEGREITRLPLRARLAVLSACSTARGRVRYGEGLIGLSWAFLVAGCPTIVATQWRVPSDSTATLMIDFHRELARGTAPAEALRRAQLRLMQDPRYRHPFYWSAFVVVGAGRS